MSHGYAVPGDGRPPFVVDATVAEHLEVLQVVPFGRLGVVERVDHADAFEGRLLNAVDDVGAGSPAASRMVAAMSITWQNWVRVCPLALIPLGQCTMVPLRVPPQCEATCLVH